MPAQNAFVTDCVALWPSTARCDMHVHIFGPPCRCATTAEHSKLHTYLLQHHSVDPSYRHLEYFADRWDRGGNWYGNDGHS